MEYSHKGFTPISSPPHAGAAADGAGIMEWGGGGRAIPHVYGHIGHRISYSHSCIYMYNIQIYIYICIDIHIVI